MFKNILKNSSYLFISQIFSKFLIFFYALFVASQIGVANFGIYTVALSYYSIFIVMTDLGISRYLIREKAKGLLRMEETLWEMIFLRLLISVIGVMLFTAFIYFLDPNSSRTLISVIIVSAIIPQTIGNLIDAFFIGSQKFLLSASGILIMNLANILIGLFLLYNGLSLLGVSLAILISQFVYFTYLFFFFVSVERLKMIKISFRVIKNIIQESWIYGVLGIIGLISFKIDALVLAYTRGDFEAGLYGLSYRFLEAAIFIPSAFALGIFPVVAKMFHEDKNQITPLYHKSLLLMGGLGVLVSVILIIIMPIIIKAFLPTYINAILPLQILALSLPFIFMHIPSGQIILSSEKYLKHSLYMYLFLAVVNLTLIFILIPMYGIIAACWLTVFAETLTFTTFYIFLKTKVLN